MAFRLRHSGSKLEERCCSRCEAGLNAAADERRQTCASRSNGERRSRLSGITLDSAM
jgi:hypothetical protein